MKLKELVTTLDYNNGENIVPEGTFRIGASQIGRFFTHPRQWWGENFLDEEGFKGNSASVTGTCVHYICENFETISAGGEQAADIKKQINNYILKHTNPAYKDYIEDVDKNYVESQYKPMAEAIVNDYLIRNKSTYNEPFIVKEILPNIVVGGSIDSLILEKPVYDGDATFENLVSASGGVVVDFKTKGVTSGYLPKADANMDFGYRLQLLTYAYILRSRGIMVDRIRLVYVSKNEVGRISEKTGRPLKDYPSTTSVQTEQITEEDMEYIKGIINLIAESIQLWNDKHDLRYIIAKDYRLK